MLTPPQDWHVNQWGARSNVFQRDKMGAYYRSTPNVTAPVDRLACTRSAAPHPRRERAPTMSRVAILLAGCLALGSISLIADAKSAASAEKSMGYLPNSVPWKSLADVHDSDFLSNNDRPFMYIVSREGCPACKALKDSVNEPSEHAESIKELADEFNMVAVSEAEASEEAYKEFLNPKDKHGYVPRVLFASPDNVMVKKLTNKNTKAATQANGGNYKYFYPDAESLVVGMTTAHTYFEDVKISAAKKARKAKAKEEAKKNPKKKSDPKKKKGSNGGGGNSGLDGLMDQIKAQARAQGANIDL